MVDCGRVKAIQEWVEGWQGRVLSLMGKVTLVRSVFSFLPIYMLSNAILSKTVVTKMEQYIRSFLWGLEPGRRGLHLLGCNVACQSVGEGVLAFGHLLREGRPCMLDMPPDCYCVWTICGP